MKTQSILYAVLFLFWGATVSTQTLDQGNFVIGSTIGFSTVSSNVAYATDDVEEEGEGPAATQVSITPKIGYFLQDNLVLGINVDYSFSTVKNPNKDRSNDSDLLFGPYTRAYLTTGDDMALFFELNFGFGSSSDEQFIGEDKQSVKSNIFAIGVGPGFTIFSNSDIGIEALFKYNFARSQFNTESGGVKTTTTTKTNQFDIGIGVQLYFGGIVAAGR